MLASAVSGLVFTCNPDFNIGQVGLRTGWTPVPGMTFSGEVLYSRLDQKFSGQTGVITPSTTVLAKPAAIYNYRDQDTVSFNFRAQRNF